MNWALFKVELAIRLSLQVSKDESYRLWAEKWLSGEDRSSKAAYAAYANAYTVNAYANAVNAYAYAEDSIKSSIKLGAKLELVVKFL